MNKIIVAAILFILALYPLTDDLSLPLSSVKAQEQTSDQVLKASQPIKTESRFGSKLITTTKTLTKDTTFKDDPEKEIGFDDVLDEGADGTKTTVTKITFYDGEEYDREIISTEIVEPKDKIISRGTKIIWRKIDTPDGQISYWRKMRVYATHYDSHCPGCDEWTAIGMHAGKGVIAVDPSVIKLRSNVYIPGYGKAVAGDTGGAIRGNMIDLGFDDARTAGWYAHYIDIYLL